MTENEQALAKSFHERVDVKHLMQKKKEARHNCIFRQVARYERDLEALWDQYKEGVK